MEESWVLLESNIGKSCSTAEYRSIINDPFGEYNNCLSNPEKIMKQFHQRPLDEPGTSDDEDEGNEDRSVCSDGSLRFICYDDGHDSDSGDDLVPVSRNPSSTIATKTSGSNNTQSTTSSNTTTNQDTSSTGTSSQSRSIGTSNTPPSSSET